MAQRSIDLSTKALSTREGMYLAEVFFQLSIFQNLPQHSGSLRQSDDGQCNTQLTVWMHVKYTAHHHYMISQGQIDIHAQAVLNTDS